MAHAEARFPCEKHACTGESLLRHAPAAASCARSLINNSDSAVSAMSARLGARALLAGAGAWPARGNLKSSLGSPTSRRGCGCH